jgi:hypothetical protein
MRTAITPAKNVRPTPDIIMASEQELKRLIDASLEDFAGCNFDAAMGDLNSAERIVLGETVQDEAFDKRVNGFETFARKSIAEAQRHAHPKKDKLAAAKTLTVPELMTLVSRMNPTRENSVQISNLLSTKRIVHNKKGYRIIAFRCVGVNSFIKIEGFEHVQFLEREMNRGWIPFDATVIERVLAETTATAVKKLGEHLPASAEEFIGLINMMREKKTMPEAIKKDILNNRPVIKTGEHGALVDYYIEKDGIPLIHFQGFPSKVLTLLDKSAIETSVRIAHLLKPLDEKLARLKPFKIDSLAKAVFADRKDIERLPEFSDEFTKADVDAALFLNARKGILII